jgi:hypothetical protein
MMARDQMPNSAARSWRMLLPLAAVLLLALLWTVYWFIAAGVAQSRFAEERGKLAAQGITLACAGEAWGGYPFHFEFTCNSPVLRLEDRAEVASSELLLAALAYAPWQIVALLDGPSAFGGKDISPLTAEHQRAIAALTFDREWRLNVSAEIPALDVQELGTAARVMLHTRPSGAGGTDIAVSAKDVLFQPPGTPPLSIGEGELLGTLSLDRSLNIERLSLQQQEVRYWGTGKLALDTAHRPSGRLDTQTNDLNGLLDLLDPHLQLTDEQKAGLRSMLGLLGSEAKAPLIAREGVLYLGPFKLAELKPLY